MHGPLPRLTPENKDFWTCGADNELRIQRCTSCGTLRHPQGPRCRECRSAEFDYAAVSGRGTVLGVTINAQQWLPDMTPPYVICIVGLEEDPRVRITSNLIECDLDAAHVGLAVEVVFSQIDDVWLPYFRPIPHAAPQQLPAEDAYEVYLRTPVSSKRFEHDVVLSGLGYSEIGRRLNRDPLSLTADAALAAIADAGLRPEDIDGLATYPGAGGYAHGFSEGGVAALEEALRLRPTWHAGGDETPGQAGAIVAAMLAVSAGLCRHVLCFRTVWESSFPLRGGAVPAADGRVSGAFLEYRAPFGAMSAANWIGMNASNYMARYGASREVLGRIAVNARTNAGRNDRAIYRDPFTLDDYFDARIVTTPFGLYDCDVPCDGAIAIIVSAAETAKDLAIKPVYVEAVGTQIIEPISWDQGTLSHEPQLLGPARHLWSRTHLTHDDVDLALLYDGFSFNCLSWIESLGFCGFGEATDFIGDGTTIALDGSLPLNPHGGQLSGGRTHGFGFLAEAMEQLRGTAGVRQVKNAKVAVASTGGGVPSSAWLLRSQEA